MMFDAFPEFLPAEYRVKFATEPWERRQAAALRRKVFCEEQGVFANDDRDAIDEFAIQLVAISSLGVAPDDVVGTVRIHEAEPGLWWGSRLAVATAYRGIGALGTSLSFYAHVQSQNALLFQRLHWRTIEETEFHGRAHHFMQADLAYYPPIANPEVGFLSLPKQAA